jgi:hypothetical protein
LRSLRLTLPLLVVAMVCFCSGAGAADPAPKRGRTQTAQAREASVSRSLRSVEDETPVTTDREKMALRFAEENHDELFSLLQTLRKTNSRYYQDALRELSREAERLAKIGDRDSDRYRLSLKIWKLDSRLRLEVARLSMAQADEIESRLMPLLTERHAVRLELLELEQLRANDRLHKVSQQLATAKEDGEKRVSQELERLSRTIISRNRPTAAQQKKSQKAPLAETKKKTEAK